MSEKNAKSEINVGNILGANLRKLRKAKGWTPAKLFEESGVSVSAIRKYEKGIRFPERPYIEALAKALGCKFSDLYSEEQLPVEAQIDMPEITKAISKAMATETKPLMEALAEISKQKDLKISSLEKEIRNLKQELRNQTALVDENKKTPATFKKIPPDILDMLSRQDDVYFKSLRRVLQGLEEKKNPSKKQKTVS